MLLPNFSRLRLGTDEMARTGGFYSLTPNEADELIAQRERDPVSLDEFFSVFRVALPNADGTLRYKFYRADALWRSIQAVYAQKRELVYPDVQAPVWYEDWYELHNQYDPNGAVPPEVNQLLRFANFTPGAPPAWALPTPAPAAPAPAPAPAAPEPAAPTPAAPVVAPVNVTLQRAWRTALDRAGLVGRWSTLPEPGLPLDEVPLQANVLDNMLHDLQVPLSAYSAQPNDDRAMAIVRDYMNDGVYEIFEAHAWQFFQYESGYNQTLSALVRTMVSLFVANPEPQMPREMVRAILMLLSAFTRPGVEDGFFPIAQPQRREVNDQLRGVLRAWERLEAVRVLSQDRKLQFAVDRLLGRNPVAFADPLDQTGDVPYTGPTQEERDWRLQQTGMRRELHDPLVALIGALHRNQRPPPGERVDDEELQRALDAVPFPLPTDGHNRRNPWSFIFASSNANRTLENDAHPHRLIWMLMAWVEAERNVFDKVKLMICAFLRRYVVAYPEVGRAINTHNVNFRHTVRALAARRMRQPQGHEAFVRTEAAYELAAYLQLDHDDWLLAKGVERAVSTGLSGALNSAVRRQQRHLAAARARSIASFTNLTAYKRAWEDERRLKHRIWVLWKAFERRATLRPDHAQGILLPYLRESLQDAYLRAAVHGVHEPMHEYSGWSQERAIAKLREWIEYQTTRGEGGGMGALAAQGIIADLLAHDATQQQQQEEGARARPEGEATPGRRRQRTGEAP